MTLTTVESNANIAIKLFEKSLIPEMLKETISGQYVGSILKQEKDLENMRGEQITTQLGPNLTGIGLTEGQSVDGNEEAITFQDDVLRIGELSQSVLIPTKMSMGQKRVAFDHKIEAYERIKKWFNATMDIWFFNQLAGNDATSISGNAVDGRFYPTGKTILATGNQTAMSPSSTRIIRAGGAENDESLTENDTITFKHIDAAVEMAKNATPYISPVKIGDRYLYVCFVSQEQLTDLIRDKSSPVQWGDIALSRLKGGENPDNNPIITGEGGIYRETLIVANTRVPFGVHSEDKIQVANTRRAIFCGENAACFAYSGADAGEASFFEQHKNGGKELQITGNLLGGLKKTVYNNVEFSSIVISTYAAAHTS